MTQNLEASQLSLNDVRRLLKMERQTAGSFTDFLSLEPLTDFEQQELLLKRFASCRMCSYSWFKKGDRARDQKPGFLAKSREDA